MSEPLTDAEVAELREKYGALGDCADFEHVWAFFVAARNAMPFLLDELELLRRRDREQAAGEEVLRQQLRDAERKIEMLRGERG